MWTIIGQWIFLIVNWVFGLWHPLLPIFAFVMGLLGGLSLPQMVLIGFVFPTPELFYWTAIPAFTGHLLFILFLFIADLTGSSEPAT